MKKQISTYITIILVGILLLNLIINDILALQKLGRYMEDTGAVALLLLRINIWGIMFGVLIEWWEAKRIITGHMKPNRLIIPTIVLLLVQMLLALSPIINNLKWLMMVHPHPVFRNSIYAWLLNPFGEPRTHVAINILTGVMLVRSLAKKESD